MRLIEPDVQYEDFTGTLALDGHATGSPLFDIIDVPEGFYPVGFDFHFPAVGIEKDPKIGVDVFLFDLLQLNGQVLDVYARERGEVKVSRMRATISFNSFMCLFKRSEFVVKHRSIGDASMLLEDEG